MRMLNLTNIDCCRLVKDKKYGSMDKNVAGGWNGMIGELVRKVSGAWG